MLMKTCVKWIHKLVCQSLYGSIRSDTLLGLRESVCVFINQDKDINIPLTPCYDLNYVTFIAAYLCGQRLPLALLALSISIHFSSCMQSNAKLFSNFFITFLKVHKFRFFFTFHHLQHLNFIKKNLVKEQNLPHTTWLYTLEVIIFQLKINGQQN